ncbi:glycosyltransferase [Halopseudomonas salegens]|uniref:glycosyltransferase n=1 Tax=Halopseudomonas salegens TaxID=1434072 RepID=UPI0012FE339D|nr:glycosyltransferase [Halopseudomonas salegens]
MPVYRGLEETRRCIESVLASELGPDVELVVINDASPEPALVDWLNSQAARFTLLHNESNLGFVATVNRGMRLHPERDVVLLNSDTEVAGDWLPRLRHAAHLSADTATLTPWSNNATICSYPDFCRDNALPEGFALSSLDRLCATALEGQRVEIPTAIGFCMYIRRACLDAVGLFDEASFGKGYGEENEFCMRSARSGWKHYLAADVFVYHAGGVSFAASQSEHQGHGHKALLRLFPDYDRMVQAFVASDPACSLRFALDMLRIGAVDQPRILLVSHTRGGGTSRHISELVTQLQGQAQFLLLQPDTEMGAIRLGLFDAQGWHNPQLFSGAQAECLEGLLRALQLTRIHYHHRVGLHPLFLDILDRLALPADLTLHDYYLLCPQITMTDAVGRYCGEPDESGCNRCLQERPVIGADHIAHWRRHSRDWLQGMTRIFAPSADTATRVQAYFPDVQVQAVYHEPELSIAPPRVPALAADEPLRILVLGALSPFKGPDTLEACAQAAARDGVPLQFHLLGFAYRELNCNASGYLQVHGRYAEADLPALLAQLQPHLVWFPGSCPETWSYTLSAALEAGLPVVAPALGAFPERLAGREWTWLVVPDRPVDAINQHFMQLREVIREGRPPLTTEGSIATDSFRYATDYFSPDERAVQPAASNDILAHLRGLLPPPALGNGVRLTAGRE